LRRGLAVAHADAAVVTNISSDHFGEYGIDDLQVGGREAERGAAVATNGRLILNADDPLLRTKAANSLSDLDAVRRLRGLHWTRTSPTCASIVRKGPWLTRAIVHRLHHMIRSTISGAVQPCPLRTILAQVGEVRVQCKPRKRRTASKSLSEFACFRSQQRVIGIQNQATVGRHGRANAQLHVRQPCQIIDAVLAKVIGADIGHHGSVGVRHGKTAPQNTAACRFQNRRLRAPIAHHWRAPAGPE